MSYSQLSEAREVYDRAVALIDAHFNDDEENSETIGNQVCPLILVLFSHGWGREAVLDRWRFAVHALPSCREQLESSCCVQVTAGRHCYVFGWECAICIQTAFHLQENQAPKTDGDEQTAPQQMFNF